MQQDKRIRKEIEELVVSYLGDGHMEKDFMMLKPTERVRFLEKVLPYFITVPKNIISKKESSGMSSSLLERAGIKLK